MDNLYTEEDFETSRKIKENGIDFNNKGDSTTEDTIGLQLSENFGGTPTTQEIEDSDNWTIKWKKPTTIKRADGTRVAGQLVGITHSEFMQTIKIVPDEYES